MSQSTQTNERRVADARIEVHRDLEDLGRALRREEARLARHGIAVAGAVAALGFLIGLGGLKVTTRVLTFGAIAGAALAFARSRGYITAPGASSYPAKRASMR